MLLALLCAPEVYSVVPYAQILPPPGRVRYRLCQESTQTGALFLVFSKLACSADHQLIPIKMRTLVMQDVAGGRSITQSVNPRI